ncbi:protein-export chaperone SecB [Oceanobacillus locisalsi]|uniref:Protein-export chaperone SecB n=1 Tax=Oceanobacillus locisalsi TaxID=546107 RepID=A0ABW3NJ58_9BACI
MSEDQNQYKKLIEAIELNEIELLSLNCNQNKDFPHEKRENLSLALKNNIVTTAIEGMELHVQIEFGVIAYDEKNTETSANSEDKENIHEENILFRIDFSLMLNYVFDLENVEDIAFVFDKEIDTFVNNNVPINAWPYARETISSITTRMGFPALIIPTYKNLQFI